jgi:hypothetical protein
MPSTRPACCCARYGAGSARLVSFLLGDMGLDLRTTKTGGIMHQNRR